MGNKQISHVTPSDQLRLRVLQIKSKVPMGIDYIPYFEQVFGSQSEKKRNYIRSVWNLRATDEEITDKLEQMVEHIKSA